MNSTRSWKKPTDREVDRALALLGQPAQVRYFFDRLENAEWIEPLRARGYFRQPPEPIRDERRGTTTYPPWPEARYLARMAEHRPEIVCEVILSLPDTDNIAVLDDLADAALRMPPQIAARLVEKMTRWLQHPHQRPLSEKLSEVMGHLARGGEIGPALVLARSVLEIVHEKPLSVEVHGETHELPGEPRARLDEWEYERVLKERYVVLLERAPEEAFVVLLDLLTEAIRVRRRKRGEEDWDDYSWIWRPAVEEHEQNHGQGIDDVLVRSVRDAAEKIIVADSDKLRWVVQAMEGRCWVIFRRIALHALRRFAPLAPDLVRERLTDRALFEASWTRHEYALLAEERFGLLEAGERATILGWIDGGPDLDEFARRQEGWTGKVPEADEVERYRKMWERDRLAPIAASLPQEWAERYGTLVAEVGPAEHPEFSSYSASYIGPTSPKSVEELRAMDVEALVEFLGTWRPVREEFSPSPEGLGRALIEVVKQDPERFSLEALRFERLDRTYVRALLRGLEESPDGVRLAWTEVLALCEWVVTEPREGQDGPRERRDGDPDWGWTRKVIAGLLSRGCRRNEIPSELRIRVWDVLRRLTEDPDPTPEEEVGRAESFDPITLSINTVRGEAMHAVVQYALWVHRQRGRGHEAEGEAVRGFGEMPEVREVLEAHLDVERERTRTIRAVYGQYFPWLFLLDPESARAHAGVIFPLEEGQDEFFKAAWGAYVIYCPPYDNVLPVLRNQYHRGIEEVGRGGSRLDTSRDPHSRLAEHLMAFYWRGKLVLDDPLLVRFWEMAPASLGAHALSFVGRVLGRDNQPMPEAMIERLARLWAARLEVARAEPEVRGSEMAAFGWWYTARKFDETWVLRQLNEAVKIAGRVKHDHKVLEQLSEDAVRFPSEAIAILESLLEADPKGWRVLWWRDQIAGILRAALSADNPSAREAAKSLVHALGRRGYFEFRELLKR